MEIFNWHELMQQEPTFLIERRGIRFFEDPQFGMDTTVIAVIGKVAFDSGFYDPWLCKSDIEMIWDKYEAHIKELNRDAGPNAT